jgi:hypothetical protein
MSAARPQKRGVPSILYVSRNRRRFYPADDGYLVLLDCRKRFTRASKGPTPWLRDRGHR